MTALADDAEGEQRGQPRRTSLAISRQSTWLAAPSARWPRDSQTFELFYPPVVHEEFVAVDGLVAGDRQGRFHGLSLQPGWL